jgi:hypothetical protein
MKAPSRARQTKKGYPARIYKKAVIEKLDARSCYDVPNDPSRP